MSVKVTFIEDIGKPHWIMGHFLSAPRGVLITVQNG